MDKNARAALLQEPPLSLYVHLPWCEKKCPYCDFNSHEIGTKSLRDTLYVEALIRDLQFEAHRVGRREVNSLFIGGGTPSLFSVQALESLMDALRSTLNFSTDAEITLEANPGTAEAQRFQGYAKIGINRLSIGVQSFDDEKLKLLGRIHNAKDALGAIELAHASGFENINIDLMFALPGQTVGEAIEDISRACSQNVTHISWYQLTIEPNTYFYKHPPSLPPDDDAWNMQTGGGEVLGSAGFLQYEVSAYAAVDRQSRHNLNYWQFGDYLGLGAGAHGKLTDVAEKSVTRFARHRLPESYMAKAGSNKVIVEERSTQDEDLVLEFMLNALRLPGGFSTSLFSARTGLAPACIKASLDIAEARGMLSRSGQHVRPTKLGQTYLNDLLQLFMPAGNNKSW